MSTFTKIYPEEISVKPPLLTSGAVNKLNESKCVSNLDYNNITIYHKKTTAYDITKRNIEQNPSLWKGNNNIKERFNRWKKEKYIIIPTITESTLELINFLFTISLFILTLILLFMAFHYELELVPKSIINRELLTESQENDLNWYNKVQISTDIIKGISVVYLISYSSYYIFKRTTV